MSDIYASTRFVPQHEIDSSSEQIIEEVEHQETQHPKN